MAARERRARRHVARLFRYLLFGTAVFALFRVAGPALVVVQGDALAPILQENDVLLVRRVGSREVNIDDVVVSRGTDHRMPLLPAVRQWVRDMRAEGVLSAPPGLTRDVIRLVVALPGDTVWWDHQRVTVTPPPSASREERSYHFDALHSDLPQQGQTAVLQDREYFLVALAPGRADSRVVGAVHRDRLRFRVQSIILPGTRRGPVEYR